MKRILTVLICFFPLCLNAQILGDRHHLEAGVGLALSGEVLFETDFKDAPAADLFGAYRFDITPAISLGAVYTFVAPHSGQAAVDYVAHTGGRHLYTHQLDAFAEFRHDTEGPVSFFIGIGGGANLTHRKYSVDLLYRDLFRPDVCIHVGAELYDHLRITIRHNHDLYFPFSSLVDPGFPYYCINVGWLF